MSSFASFWGRPQRHRIPLQIAGIYALVGALWIIFSDRALSLLIPPAATDKLTLFQTVKGLFFIGVTAALVYWLVKRAFESLARTEAALQESEARYRQLFADASDGILLSDAQGRILEVNPSICDLLGWSRQELLGRNIEDLLPPDELARQPFRTKELEGGRTLVSERRLLSRSGLRLDTEIGSRLVEGGSLLSLVRDVTRRHQLEEQLRQAQKMEAVGRLSGGIAHDLNNLLTVVLVNGELIAEALPAGRADLKGDLEDLRAAAQRGAAMIGKLLSFSRRAPLSFVTLDLADVVGELLKTLRRMLPAQMSLDFFPDASGVQVRADPTALEQIVLNLATNARDAMPKGGRLVIETRRVRLESEPAVERPGGDYGCLLMRDDGVGMDEETRRRAFEPFFTTKSASQGGGLGMSIVYGLAQQHGGFVEFESAPGAGTAVRVYLPVAAVETRRVTTERGTRTPKGGDERILLVEDEEPLRRVAQRALERLGYTVVPATDGQQALELYRGQEGRIDLVITDLMMPRLGGVALYEALRHEGRRTRFLFTSGYSADEILDQDFPEGGPALLQKPWTLADFTAKVREVLDREEELR